MSGVDTMPRWLDRLAHDLRGPLAPLQTAAHLLRSDTLAPDRQAELLELIERQTRRMARMLDEFDDWSRAGQGRLLGATGDCEPHALLAMALEGDPALAAVAPDVDGATTTTHVHGDPTRLVQMMRALASFAAARSQAPPRIDMARVGDRLRLDVESNGPDGGIDKVSGLLDAPLPDPPDQGLGLRLLVARAIAEAHGGSLVAERREGGILLRCELPAA